jgi:hypothetical protein
MVIILLNSYSICCLASSLQIKARLADNKVAHGISGILIFHDLERNLAIVSVFPKGGGIRAACLDHCDQQLESPTKVVALRRCFGSGKLMATTGTLDGDPAGASCKQVPFSTCEISMVQINS